VLVIVFGAVSNSTQYSVTCYSGWTHNDWVKGSNLTPRTVQYGRQQASQSHMLPICHEA